MAAASAVIFDPTPPEMLVEHLRERGSEHRLLKARIQELRDQNRALTAENRALKRELMVARIESGASSAPATISDALTGEIWLTWARRHHHTDACACHRCTTARQVL